MKLIIIFSQKKKTLENFYLMKFINFGKASYPVINLLLNLFFNKNFI